MDDGKGNRFTEEISRKLRSEFREYGQAIKLSLIGVFRQLSSDERNAVLDSFRDVGWKVVV